MKDPLHIWGRILRRSYSTVSAKVAGTSEQQDCRENSGKSRAQGKLRTSYSLGLVGLVTAAIGMAIMFVHPYQIVFNLKITLSEGGEIFEIWRKPPVDLYLRVFLFNVTNAEEFMSGKEKLKMQEVGPYVYKELMSHENVTFNDNGTLTAYPKHPLLWIPELSVGDQDTDQLVLPNIALLSITHVVSEHLAFTKFGLNLIIKSTGSQPLVKMSPKEFMFGYKSTLLTLGNKFLNNWIYFEKLGLIDRMYDFSGDFETVYTGEGDITKAGLLDSYMGSTEIPQWDAPCGTIRGTSDGTKFATNIKPNDTLTFFRKSMCRPKNMIRVNSTISSGLQGYVYNFEPNANDNGVYNPENSCYCKTKRCLPPGLLDVHECYYGFPIALSYPHFLEADPSLSSHVDGMHPDPVKHKTYFVIQPDSGLPLDLAVRYQINMALGDVSDMANVRQFSNKVIPMLWTEIRMYQLPESLASKFLLYLKVLPLVEIGFMYLALVLGSLLTFLSLYKLWKCRRRTSQMTAVPWIDEETAAMDRKLSSYLPAERRRMSAKELDVYFSSLVAPLNQLAESEQLISRDFPSLHEGDI